jgi:N-acetylglucosamine-6-phosphate deacetylase
MATAEPSTIVEEGFLDLQVNGYAGVDFNSDTLTLDELRSACQRLADDSVAGILATVITADIERMLARLRRIVSLRQQDPLIGQIIWGLHIEGPFLRPESGYVGAHPPQYVRAADVGMMQTLLDAAGGLARIVTLAPEQDAGFQVTRLLANKGMIVSAGHCDPSTETLFAAIDAGLSMFTHLGNGCPALLPRHDNIIQRVLSLADRLWITFIADGAHVPFAALGNYLRIVGSDRAIIVTDAIAAAGMGPGRYRVGDVDAVVGADLVPRLSSNPQHLAGSALTMPRAANNLRQHLNLTETEIAKLCGGNARRVVGR